MRKRAEELSVPVGDDGRDDPRFVVALARGLSLMRSFRRGDAGLGNQELAERTGLAKSTVSRLTYTLSKLGYLSYSTATGRYALSASALALGFTALGSFAVRDVARPLMQQLADRCGASVALGAPDRRTMVYIEHCRSAGPLHMGIEIGSHIRMATSSMGRAYLASLPDDQREVLLREICGGDSEAWAGVARAVEQFQSRGYVTSTGEWKQEINSVGVPLLLGGAQPFALNCGGSALILKEEMLDAVGTQLVELAARIRNKISVP